MLTGLYLPGGGVFDSTWNGWKVQKNSCGKSIINQSIKSSICKAPLKPSSQKRLLWVGLHKEPSLKVRLKLFTTSVSVLEMRWQRVPGLWCHDTETARTITHSPSTWHNHAIVVSRAKPGAKGNGDDRYTTQTLPNYAGDRQGIRLMDVLLPWFVILTSRPQWPRTLFLFLLLFFFLGVVVIIRFAIC